MPSPVPPSDFKNLIVNLAADFCDKFVGFLTGFPQKFYEWYAWAYDEDGNFSADFITDLCAACPCAATTDTGGGGNPPGDLPTPVIMASDGLFSDKVRITWDTVVGATNYDIYRNLTNSSATAAPVGSSTTTLYDDATAVPGQIYFYWVKARNTTQSSAFSLSDSGYATANSLAAVADLTVTRGNSPGNSGVAIQAAGVQLIFSPVSMATAYDFYRNTVDDFTTAALIDSNHAPFDNSHSLLQCPTSTCLHGFVDNVGELVWADHTMPDKFATYFYWVVAKKLNGVAVEAIGVQSNSASGWAIGKGFEKNKVISSFFLQPPSGSQTCVVPGSATKAWIYMFGSQAGGGGGDASVGGGGGGSGAVMGGLLNVTPGKNLKIVFSPDADPDHAAEAANGVAGPVSTLQYDGSGSFVDILTASAPGAGLYNALGGGAGGAGGTATVDGSVASSYSKNGHAGLPGVGVDGGRSGYQYGFVRSPSVVPMLDPFNSAQRGAGATGNPLFPATAKGGVGLRGRAVIVFYIS